MHLSGSCLVNSKITSIDNMQICFLKVYSGTIFKCIDYFFWRLNQLYQHSSTADRMFLISLWVNECHIMPRRSFPNLSYNDCKRVSLAYDNNTGKLFNEGRKPLRTYTSRSKSYPLTFHPSHRHWEIIHPQSNMVQ